jgi:parallel beta-helix repeat protein
MSYSSPLIEDNFIDSNIANSEGWPGSGGGIVVWDNCHCVIRRNEITRNTSSYGGAIDIASGSNPKVEDNTIVDNLALKWGGGIAVLNGSSPLIEYNLIDSNIANSEGWPGSGGGIVVWDNCHGEIRWNEITRNTSTYGGGIDIAAGSDPTVENNTIVDNLALKWGGGIAVLTGSSPLIEHNLIDSNTATSVEWPGSGGGIAVWDTCDTEIKYNVIARNSSSHGGGVENSSASTTLLENNTFYGNHGSVHGGAIGSLTGAVVTVRNCIIANTTGQPAIQCWDGGIVNPDCNDMWANTVDYSGCGPGANDFYEDPMLCDPAHGNFYVDCISPCIDHPICGFVGALGAGCGSTRIEPTTWGAIKALWR